MMNENAGAEYKGMDRFEAREKVLSELKERDYLVEKKPINHAVRHCYRCHTVIEPRISKQWFVRMKPLAEKALEVVRNGEVNLMPKRWEKVYFNWLENIRDWCISRQIWWGHRIPAYYCECGETVVAEDMPEKCPKCGGTHLRQDEDVLDTWFSSWLWPFSTLGWPEKTPELKYFYPTATLVTGADILFFWVARMVMAGMYAMEQIPFKDVFLHGIVRDEIGRKMSKSLGNSPDPIDIIEKYGADALRFSMLYNTSQGQDVFYSEKLIEMGSNFANKIWNVSKFVLMNLQDFNPEEIDLNEIELNTADQWILSRLNETIVEVNTNLDKFFLNDAAKAVYEFLWGDFCDWYVEISKIRLYAPENINQKRSAQFILWTVLEQGLKILHPFMPFITEEIWKRLPATGETIMLADYPEFNPDMISITIQKNMEFVQNIIKGIRNIRTEMNIQPGKKLKSIMRTVDGEEQVVIEENREIIMKLAGIEEMSVGCEIEKPELSAAKVVNSTEIYILLEGLIDKEKEIARLQKEIAQVQKDLDFVSAKLNNEKFVAKAPANVIEEMRTKQKDYSDKFEKLNESLKEMESKK